MAIHVQYNDPIWKTLDRAFVTFPLRASVNGCLRDADWSWLVSDDVPGHYCWWPLFDSEFGRQIGFSDPYAAVMFRLRCG